MGKKYYWRFNIEECRFGEMYGLSCSDVVNEENKKAWSRFISDKINELMKEETLQDPEFMKTLVMVEEEKRQREEWRIRDERLREKQWEDRQRRKCMERPKITFIPKGLTVDYEKEYAVFFDQEVMYSPIDSDDFLYQFRMLNRWQDKSVPQIIEMGRPDAAYAIAIEQCRHIPLFLYRDDLQKYIKKYKDRIKKMIVGAFSGLVAAVRAWNHEEKRLFVNNFIFEQSNQYGDFRGLQKTLIQMMISEPFVGDPVQVTREMSDEEAYQVRQDQRRKEFADRIRLAEEREAKSLIPLNPEYETEVFNCKFITWELSMIDLRVDDEAKHIRAFVDCCEYMKAATCFLQLTKSMCKHFIENEHYNYFDDMYTPEYTIQSLVDYFNGLISQDALPEEVKNYLHKGWKEIKTYEACTDYGLLHHCNL